MNKQQRNRRKFIKGIAGSAAVMAGLPDDAFRSIERGSFRAERIGQAPAVAKTAARIRFAVIGVNHGHINTQVTAVQRGGGELVSVYAKEPDLVAEFVK